MTRVLTSLKLKTISTRIPTGAATAGPLSADELRKIDASWRACNYVAAGMIYLRENPLLRKRLKRRAR